MKLNLTGFWKWREGYYTEVRADGKIIDHREANLAMRFGTWFETPEGFEWHIPNVGRHQIKLASLTSGTWVMNESVSGEIEKIPRPAPIPDEGLVNSNSFRRLERDDRLVMRADSVIEWMNECRPTEPFSLVTTHSDISISLITTHSSDRVDDRFLQILDDELLDSWYAANAAAGHPKLRPIPIGVRHSIADRNGISFKQYADMLKAAPSIAKDKMFNVSFLVSTNTRERSKCLRASGFKNQRLKLPDYLNDMARSRFCLSPEGTGIDCHRTWEALYCKTIPIITDNPMVAKGMYDGLPVIVLANWEEFRAEDYTEEVYLRMVEGFDPKCLQAERWVP